MKKFLLRSIVIVLVSSNGFTEESIETSINLEKSDVSLASKKFRVGIAKSLNQELESKARIDGISSSSKEKNFEAITINGNYDYNLIDDISLSVGISHLMLNGGVVKEELGHTSISTNILNRVAEKVVVFGGINLGKWTVGEDIDGFDAGFGIQVGALVDINENFALNLEYKTLNNEDPEGIKGYNNGELVNTGTLSSRITALQLGVNYKF